MLSIDLGMHQIYIYDWQVQKQIIIDYDMTPHGIMKLYKELVDIVYQKTIVIVEQPTHRSPQVTFRFGKLIGLIHGVCGHFEIKMIRKMEVIEKNNKSWKSKIKELEWWYMEDLKKKKSKKANDEYCQIVKDKLGGEFIDHNMADAWMIGLAYQRDKS